MIDFSKFNSLISLTDYFNTDDICKEAIVESRWGKGDEQLVICPYCGKIHCVRRKDGKFRCRDCRRNFSCLVGTIFENTNISLRKWFIAMYIISCHRKGISSYQLAKNINVTQTTAWYMLQKIRTLFKQDDSEALNGIVECDEVYIGGKEKWKHKSMRTLNTQGRSTKTKTPIFGMMERTTILTKKGEEEFMSYVHAMVVSNTSGTTLKSIISQFVINGTTVMTDELNSYNGLSTMGYNHQICNHNGLKFVCNGTVYTNNIECFWSHFRRMITGSYHDVSDEHLQSYIDEAVWRWNTRKASQENCFSEMFRISIGLRKKWTDIKVRLVAA